MLREGPFGIFLLFLCVLVLDSCSSIKESPQVEEAIVVQEEEVEYVEIPTELEEIEASEQEAPEELAADLLSKKTFPLLYNEYVEQWIKYFTGRGRKHFKKYLSRSTLYMPLMQKILKEEGLPSDLIYLAMIESGFNYKATSRVGAKGPWQFMPYTGKRFGLKVDFWVDERRDFEKATRAAAKYLKELHHIFGSWYLAAAGYNAGEGKVLRAIREHKTRNFWKICRMRKALRAETRNYVPKIIAAALISKNPKKYGIENVNYRTPLTWETVSVPGSIDSGDIAKTIGVSKDSVKILNPELRVQITPAKVASYEVRVPIGYGDTLLANVSSLKKKKASGFVYHRVRRGDTLGRIARSYGSSVRAIKEVNNIRNARYLRLGKKLAIPRRFSRKARSKNRGYGRSKGRLNGSTHTVARGETLWDLSRRYKMSVNEIKKINGLRRSRDLKAGMKITVSKKASKRTTSSNKSYALSSYKVKRGDTLWSISKKFGISVRELKQINGISNSRGLKAGSKIKVAKGAESTSIYRVRRGDTFWSLSKKFGLSIKELKKRNNLAKGHTLKSGMKLKVSRNL